MRRLALVPQLVRLSLAIVVVASASGAPHTVFAQTGAQGGRLQPLFEHFPELSATVWSVVQDHRGFLWVATWDGLWRYDGHRFKQYRSVPGDSTTLASMNVGRVYEAQDGTLWATTQRSGAEPAIHRYDRTLDAFTRFRYRVPDSQATGDDVLGPLHMDRTGTLWIGTYGDGLIRFDPTTGAFSRVTDSSAPADQRSIHAIHEDEDGTLWIGSSAGLARLDLRRTTFHSFTHDPGDTTTIEPGGVRAILQDRKGQIWVETNRGVLCRMDRHNTRFTCYSGRSGRQRLAAMTNISPILEDDSGMLWLGGDGLTRFDPETGESWQYPTAERTSTGFSSSGLRSRQVTSLHQDRSGVLWIGTRFGGLHKLSRQTPLFSDYTPPGEAAAQIFDVYEDGAGALWVAETRGVFRHDRATGRWEAFPHQPRGKQGVSTVAAASVLESRSGSLWIAWFGAGVSRHDPQTGTSTHYRHAPDDPTTLSTDIAFSLYEDRSGRLWIGTVQGLNMLDAERGAFTRYTSDPDDSTTIGPAIVWDMLEDREGRFWVATNSGGLNLMDRQRGTFKRFLHDPSDPSSISSNDVSYLLEDASGAIWTGTMAGLNRLDPATGRFTRFTTATSCIPSDRVGAVLEDDEGYLWLSTGRGIVRFDVRSDACVVYDEHDGVLSLLPLDGATSPRGEMLFATVGGVYGFFPQALARSTEPPPVALTDFRLFNRSVAPRAAGLLKRQISEADEIVLRHHEHSVGFEFAALHFVRPEKNRYAYRLEGFDRDWIDTGSQNSATYTNLSPGTYTFRVKAANSDGVWNEEGASVRIVIRPPWWRTPWAYGLYGLLFVLGVVAVDRVQRRRLIARERERSRELETKLRTEAAEAWANYLQAENERKTQELDQARELQLSMLPGRLPDHPHAELAAAMQTATEVGGDYYDVHVSADGTLTLAIGDATGHGARAGTMVTAMKSLFAHFVDEPDPALVLGRASEALRRVGLPKLYMAFALAKLRGPVLDLAGAGMPPALVWRAGTGAVEAVPLKGIPLGGPNGVPYRTRRVELRAGDTVVLMSDGLPELRNPAGEQMGYERMAHLVASSCSGSAEEVVARLRASAVAWTAGESYDDDVTIVALRAKEHASGAPGCEKHDRP